MVSIVLEPDLHERVRAEAARRGQSVSRFVRELIAERIPAAHRRRGRTSVLLKLCGLARGELVIRDLDRDIYGD